MSYQAYLDSIKEKTGKSPEDFRVLAQKKGLLDPGVKAGSVLTWLKEDFGLGRGHAMAIYGTLNSVGTPKLNVDEAVAQYFSGRRVIWRQTYEQLRTMVTRFGSDVTVQPGKSYLSLLRNGKKFAIIQATSTRFDVGIKLKSVKPTNRFGASGSWNSMVTHRVRIETIKQVDAELVRWLHRAYDGA